jgi:hypothetical protein
MGIRHPLCSDMAAVPHHYVEKNVKTLIIALSLFAMVVPTMAAEKPTKCWNCDQIIVPRPTPKGSVCPMCGAPIKKPR